MGELFLIRESDGCCFIFTPHGHKEWKPSRGPAGALDKDRTMLCYTHQGWAVQDQGIFGKYIRLVPASAEAAKLDSSSPPLGDWNLPDGSMKHTLTDCCPTPGEPEGLLSCIDLPFVRLDVTRTGEVWSMDITLRAAPVPDDELHDTLRQATAFFTVLARRPRAVLFVRWNALDPPALGARHMRWFMKFAAGNAIQFYITIRGSVTILRPKGAAAVAFLSGAKMIQRLLPPPWPDAFVPTCAEADAFMAPLMRAIVTKVPEGVDQEMGVAIEAPGSYDPSSLADDHPLGNGAATAVPAPLLPAVVPATADKATPVAQKPAAPVRPRRCGCCKRRGTEASEGVEKPGAPTSEEAALAAVVEL